MKRLLSFVRDDRGTETVEWGIMAGLIIVGLVTVVAAIGTWVGTKMTAIQTELEANP